MKKEAKKKKLRKEGRGEKYSFLLFYSFSSSFPKMIEDSTLEPLRARGYELGGFLGSGAFSEVRRKEEEVEFFLSVKSSEPSLTRRLCSLPLFLSFFHTQFPGHLGDAYLDGGSGGDQEDHRRRGRRRGVRGVETAIDAMADRQ